MGGLELFGVGALIWPALIAGGEVGEGLGTLGLDGAQLFLRERLHGSLPAGVFAGSDLDAEAREIADTNLVLDLLTYDGHQLVELRVILTGLACPPPRRSGAGFGCRMAWMIRCSCETSMNPC